MQPGSRVTWERWRIALVAICFESRRRSPDCHAAAGGDVEERPRLEAAVGVAKRALLGLPAAL